MIKCPFSAVNLMSITEEMLFSSVNKHKPGILIFKNLESFLRFVFVEKLRTVFSFLKIRKMNSSIQYSEANATKTFDVQSFHS